MKRLFLLLTLWCSTAGAVEPIQMFVMAGQSNMYGAKGFAEFYPSKSADAHLDKSIAFYWTVPDPKKTLTIPDFHGATSGKWGGLGPSNRLFGPEVSFARSAAKEIKEVAIFKYSIGGTSLFNDWGAPGGGFLYDDMIKDYSEAFSRLRLLEHPVTLRGLIWVQGESDAETKLMAKQYYFRLKNMIRDFRRVTGYEHLPVVLGVDEQNPDVKKNPQVVEAQKKIASEDPCITFVSMIGLPKADVTHLTPAGLVEHGKRLYAGWQRIAKRAECQ